MKTFKTTLALFICLSFSASAQEDGIKSTIDGFFKAMRDSDSTALKSYVAKGAIFQTIGVENAVKSTGPESFITAVGRAQKGSFDERVTYEKILIDGPMAMAWTPYTFYLNGNLSHCGVNHFSLVLQEGKWKIAHVIDTRRKENCLP